MNFKSMFIAMVTAIFLCGLSYSPADASGPCIRITGARFQRVYYYPDSRKVEELVLEITAENMFGIGGLKVYIDGVEFKQKWTERWKYAYRVKGGMAGSPFSYTETDYSKIWVRGLVPNANPQDHVIEMKRGGSCTSNSFHVAW